MRVLGVDGARCGWVVVALEDGMLVGSSMVASITDVVGADAAVIGIDMPLGETTPGARAAESAARRRLGARHSTVFTPPPLAAARAPTYGAAKRLAIEHTGKGISKQAWHLLPKMADAHAHWCAEPLRFREIHPECSFGEMRAETLLTRKKEPEGQAERLELLRAHGIDLDLDAAMAELRGARPDDVVDAAAVAWSAHRVATGRAASLPDPPELDVAGRPVAIWY